MLKRTNLQRLKRREHFKKKRKLIYKTKVKSLLKKTTVPKWKKVKKDLKYPKRNLKQKLLLKERLPVPERNKRTSVP